MKTLNLSDVEFEVICHPETLDVRGNAMASGDDAVDKETEDEILAQLESGNEWAWCCVEVVARWEGFEGRDTLGGCSYKSQADFEACSYFTDMQSVALEDLKRQIKETRAKLRRA